jgi:hypothetical protein
MAECVQIDVEIIAWASLKTVLHAEAAKSYRTGRSSTKADL